jgi:hypothetical protein
VQLQGQQQMATISKATHSIYTKRDGAPGKYGAAATKVEGMCHETYGRTASL